ncbi:MAG: hypothetical protein HYT12_04395 [Candidatus Liptonbacteria bacterium]|nr:hypothetical protein [Candidatus Liptonbacteria bacterium]
MQNIQKQIKTLAEENKLSHAYILFGEDRDNLKEFSKSLANFLENGKWGEVAGVLVDAYFIENISSSIGIEIARELKNFLWQKPAQSKRRTAVIYNAETMTREAQNAILKITEDPPKTALIILAVKNIESLLPTIVSRFQKIYLGSENNKFEPTAKVKKLVSEFLKAGARGKQEIVKKIAEDERDGEANLAVSFLDGIIVELSKNEFKNHSILREVLRRRRLLGQYSLNKRLQLAFLATLWYNG